jgi:hypothetical protein
VRALGEVSSSSGLDALVSARGAQRHLDELELLARRGGFTDKDAKELAKRVTSAQRALKKELASRAGELKGALVAEVLVREAMHQPLTAGVLVHERAQEALALAEEVISGDQILVRGSWEGGPGSKDLAASCEVAPGLFVVPSMLVRPLHWGLEAVRLGSGLSAQDVLTPAVLEALVVLGADSPEMRLREALAVARALA